MNLKSGIIDEAACEAALNGVQPQQQQQAPTVAATTQQGPLPPAK
jgi:hypothetical protein